MKSKTLLIFTITLFSILILFNNCSQQKSQWKGSIEEVDGVTIVKNPKEPMYGEDVFSMGEDLVIGEAEGKEEYMFSQVRDIAVDTAGNIYVLDNKESNVKKFSSNGKFLKSIGKKGQGPGEMQQPSSCSISPRNEILINDIAAKDYYLYIYDMNGTNIYHAGMEHLEGKNL